MDDIEKQLSELQTQDQTNTINNDDPDFELFQKAKKKKKKKDKLFSEIEDILADDKEFTEDDMFDALEFKKRRKKDTDADGDIFDTDGKEGKKSKSLENKFKPEMMNLKKLLKDNELTVKQISGIIDPILKSKTRGAFKGLTDLFISLNSANSNRLATIREMSNIKKTIADLKLKEKRGEGDDGFSSEQFGARMMAELFSKGRENVIQDANKYESASIEDIESNNKSFDELVDERLAGEENEYRAKEADMFVKYENKNPELYIKKFISTGEIEVVAIGSDGEEIEDYPVPSTYDLGKLTYNQLGEGGSMMATDKTGRTYKVIEIV